MTGSLHGTDRPDRTRRGGGRQAGSDRPGAARGHEEDAWTGIRWRIRAKTFAHVVVAQTAFESSFRDVSGVADQTTILTFRATGDELLALVHVGMPFYKPPWSPTIVGMVIDDDTDWAEVADLVTESYRVCAPQKLAKRLDEAASRPHTQPDSPLDAGSPRTSPWQLVDPPGRGEVVGPEHPRRHRRTPTSVRVRPVRCAPRPKPKVGGWVPSVGDAWAW